MLPPPHPPYPRFGIERSMNEDIAESRFQTIKEMYQIIYGRELGAGRKVHILDLGGGEGSFATFVNSQPNVTCVNLDYQDWPFKKGSLSVRANVHQIPFGKKTFEIVYAGSLLDSHMYPFDLTKLSAEIYRVLKNGGIFISFTNSLPSQDWNLFNRHFKEIKDPLPGLFNNSDEKIKKRLLRVWEKK